MQSCRVFIEDAEIFHDSAFNEVPGLDMAAVPVGCTQMQIVRKLSESAPHKFKVFDRRCGRPVNIVGFPAVLHLYAKKTDISPLCTVMGTSDSEAVGELYFKPVQELLAGFYHFKVAMGVKILAEGSYVIRAQ